MYEQLRNDFLFAAGGMPADMLALALQALDQAAAKYEITKKETALSVYGEELPEIVKVYLVCKKMEGLTDATLANYQTFLSIFFRELRKPLGTITANEIRVFLYMYQEQRKISNRTLDKYREYISRFFSWACDEGYIQSNPAKIIAPIKYEAKPREALSQVELEYLRIACNTPRERAIIEFLYSTGCRVSELAMVKKADVDWAAKSVHLFGKGRKHRTSFLNAKAEVSLQEYMDSRKDDCEYLFVSERKPHRQMHKEGLEKIVRTIAGRVSTHTQKHITPHVLRHTTATTALQSGMPIEDISKLLGHESIDTTMIYAKISLEAVQAGHKKHIV